MASSLKPKRSYDVFLSFRGDDVRNNFLGHLYTALVQQGIHTYKDDKELDKGGQISPALMEAIKVSSMAIIVFSEDYASSSWCLDEAAEIMDCKEKRGLTVFPVFYKVEPREVRTPRQKYREALVKHESRMGENSDRVKGWEKALFHAGSLAGWDLKDGDESEIIQKIVKEIATHLDWTPLHVAKHPVGIDSQVIRVKSMLNLEECDGGVLMAGLWGQGGIGKTTLAKAVYNDVFRQFEASCFLENVRETSKDCKGLVSLQAKLLSQILRRKEIVVSSVDAGINLMQRRLWKKKILLVLDDVDDSLQLNALAGEGEWFGKGSRIIFTTRDKHLLTAHGIGQDHVYEVKALHKDEAHELFTKHAFSTHGGKPIIRQDLVDAVLNYAGGLPLALEVLGSFLCGRRENEWKSTLKKLSSIPNTSINDVLRISYDGLEENEKEIFLHVACFFKGRQTGYIEEVLNSCDLETVIGLEILLERSLITFNDEWRTTLEMHDLIQYMGMDVVRQECRDDPRRRSRLWLYADVSDVLSCDHTGDCVAKAIMLAPPEVKEMHIGPKAFTKMRSLKLLILRNVRNSFQDPVCIPNWVRWLEWPGAPFLVFSSGPKKLVGLDMSTSSVAGMPKSLKEFQQLQYINMSGCETLVCMPDLSCTPNLKDLDLSECSELANFPDVFQLKNLRTLDLCGCAKIERIPDIPHILESVEVLRLAGTAIKRLPASIGNLVSLEVLALWGCESLVTLPSSIYKLQRLNRLWLTGCTNFMGFPKYDNSGDPHIPGLPSLSSLHLRRCNLSQVQFLENASCFASLLSVLDLGVNNITSLPASLYERASLEYLNVNYCHQLKEIPELPPNFRLLDARSCESLTKNGYITSLHHFVHTALTMVDEHSRDGSSIAIMFSGVEMPEWIFPAQERSVSFMASKDLYDKFLGLALCFVLCAAPEEGASIGRHVNCIREELEVASHVDGKRLIFPIDTYISDSDYISLQYVLPHVLWGEVDFSEIDKNYIHFSSTVSGATVKKWGIRILCKPLEENLKVLLQSKELMDLALLYEVRHESIGSEVSSVVPEDTSSETNLHRYPQDCQMTTENHSQAVSRRNHNLILPRGMRTTSNSRGVDEHGGVGLQLLLLD